MKAVWRTALTVVALLIVVAVPSTAANASTSNPYCGSAYACANGEFTAYRTDNGNNCSWVGNAPTLGACTNNNSTVVNNGYKCSGCDWIRLYWGSSYSGAYFCIPPGYWYDMWSDPSIKFNKGSGLSGYGQSIWNNAASAKWSGPC